jgi:hypothetical protein
MESVASTKDRGEREWSCERSSVKDLAVLACAVVLGLGGCSSKESMTNPATTAAGSSAVVGSMDAATGGMTGAGGVPAAGGGVTPGQSGSGASTAAGSGGTVVDPGGGSGAAGMMTEAGSGGSAGSAAAGSDAGAGTGATGDCTRELLSSTVDAFYAALAAHDTSGLQLADGVKFTENGEETELGKGLWATAGMVKYEHTALDVDLCTTVSESVVPDGSMDIPVGLRLKLAGGKLAEIEMIAVRPGDYTVFGSPFPSNTNAISASKDRVKWEEVVPADQRNTYAEITGWLERYFKTFPRGGCNLADNCQRLENGGGNFECSAALSCDMSAPLTGAGALRPRLLVADVETGIGVGFTMFMGHTDFHMIKMYGTEVYAVHAILGAASSSGWD